MCKKNQFKKIAEISVELSHNLCMCSKGWFSKIWSQIEEIDIAYWWQLF